MVCAMRKAAVFSVLFVLVLLAVAVIAEAQQTKKGIDGAMIFKVKIRYRQFVPIDLKAPLKCPGEWPCR